MADSEGRVGSVARAVTAFQMDGPGIVDGRSAARRLLAAAPKRRIEPAIEPAITGAMAALMEAYRLRSRNSATAQRPRSDARNPVERRQPAARDGADARRRGAVAGDRHRQRAVQHRGAAARPLSRARHAAPGRQGARPHDPPLPHRRRCRRDRRRGAPRRRRRRCQTKWRWCCSAALGELRSQGAADARDADVDVRGWPTRAPTGSKAAVKEARGGDLGAAAMTALGEGDQVLATFLKGLELYQASQLDRAAMQFQNSMQMAPTFAPSRLFLGASLAEANRHKEAAGLLQSASTDAAERGDRAHRRRGVDQGRPAGARDHAARARGAAAERRRALEEAARHRLRARRTKRRCRGRC